MHILKHVLTKNNIRTIDTSSPPPNKSNIKRTEQQNNMHLLWIVTVTLSVFDSSPTCATT